MTRWNPCGAVVDFGRYPYTELARPFRNSDAEVEIVWYPAQESAPVLPYPSAIYIQSWDRDQVFSDGVPMTTQPTLPYNHEQVKPLAFGVHQCGTRRDFAEGGLYDPNPPFVEYRPDGLPLCCGNAFEGEGGAVGGGVATVYYVPPWTGTGGAVGGGVADVHYVPPWTGTGGAVGGGVADVEYIPPGPTPGTDCASAATLTLGVEYAYEITSGDPEQWFDIALAAGTTYHVQIETSMPTHPIMHGFYGGTCPTPTPIAWDVLGPPCWEYTTTGADTLRLQLIHAGPDPITYTITIAAGAC